MLEDRPRPQILSPTDTVVEMVKGSICGTDLHILKGDVATCTPGLILGHEGTGIIHSVGASITVFKPGDRVIVSWNTSCTSCEFCCRGLASHCTDSGWVLGHLIDSTQTEYVRVPHADGSLRHLIMCSDVLLTGFECSHRAALLPTTFIMMTRDLNRLNIAATLGATHCITFGPSTVEAVIALTGGRGVNTVIQAAGVPGTFELC
ncbi:chaperonin 10-like protein [Mycena galopus ATCC 62051]|nr:chaperonin 10-like protein [Mycena galopus ATCC 62051]